MAARLGGLGACGLGLRRAGDPRWPAALALGLGAALALHFLWDWIALWAAPPGARAWQVAGGLALMLTGLLAYAAAVV